MVFRSSLSCRGQPLVAPARAEQIRIAREVGRGHQIDVQRRIVRVPVNPARVVLRHAPLAAKQRLVHLERAVLQAQVNLDLPGRIHPVVARPIEPVGVVLRVPIPPSELIGDQRLRIRAQIAVGVAHEPDVRRLADQHAMVEHLERPRQDQPVGEHRPLVHPAVAVGILQHDDAADRVVLVAPGDVVHVAGHLDRPQASLRIPVDRDRLLNHRLARDELDVIPGRHVEALQRVGGRQRRRAGRDLLNAGRPGISGGRPLVGSTRHRDCRRDEEGNGGKSVEKHRECFIHGQSQRVQNTLCEAK